MRWRRRTLGVAVGIGFLSFVAPGTADAQAAPVRECVVEISLGPGEVAPRVTVPGTCLTSATSSDALSSSTGAAAIESSRLPATGAADRTAALLAAAFVATGGLLLLFAQRWPVEGVTPGVPDPIGPGGRATEDQPGGR